MPRIGLGLGIGKRLGALYGLRMLRAFRPDLVGYWPLNEAAGAIAYDISGNARHGAYTGVTLGQTGIGDGWTAPGFAASPSFVDLYSASLAAAFPSGDFFVSLWAKPNAAALWTDGSWHDLFKVLTDGASNINIGKSTTNYEIDGSHTGSGTGDTAYNAANTATGWQHYLLTGDRTADELNLYIDGAQSWPAFMRCTGLGAWAGAIDPSWCVVGATNAGGGNGWLGNIAHVIVGNRALNGADAALLADKRGLVLFDGDSRTNSDYPGSCMAVAAVAAKRYGWRNFAVDGATLTNMIADQATQVLSNYRAGLGNHIVVVWGGINDAAGGANAATIHGRIQTYCQAARAAGFRVVVCTEIDGQSAGLNAVAWHGTIWPALNTLIRANYASYADGLADLGANASLQDATDGTFFEADAVHPNATGIQVVKGVVATAVAGI